MSLSPTLRYEEMKRKADRISKRRRRRTREGTCSLFSLYTESTKAFYRSSSSLVLRQKGREVPECGGGGGGGPQQYISSFAARKGERSENKPPKKKMEEKELDDIQAGPIITFFFLFPPFHSFCSSSTFTE